MQSLLNKNYLRFSFRQSINVHFPLPIPSPFPLFHLSLLEELFNSFGTVASSIALDRVSYMTLYTTVAVLSSLSYPPTLTCGKLPPNDQIKFYTCRELQTNIIGRIIYHLLLKAIGIFPFLRSLFSLLNVSSSLPLPLL